MPWCPKCKSEYREGFEVCADCGVKLVEELEDDSETEIFTEAYLTNAATDMEAKIIESLLESYGIEVMRRYQGSGEYTNIILGKSILGIDLYVAPSQLKEAREILSQSVITHDITQDSEEVSDDEPKEHTPKSIGKTIFIVLVVIPAVAGVLYSLYQTVSGLIQLK